MSAKKPITYGTLLTLREWPLDFAILLICGENPLDPPRDEFGKILIQNQNSRTWRLAEADIKRGFLAAVKKTKFDEFDFRSLFCDYEPNFQKLFYSYEYGTETYFVAPREFMKWCNENGIVVHHELKKYFNYDYWLSEEYWKFDEAVMLILSEKIPPLPHEIKNVFEIDDEHFECAKSLEKLLRDANNRHSITFETNSAGEVEAVLFPDERESVRELLLDVDKLLAEIQQSIVSQKDKSSRLVIKSLEIENEAKDCLSRQVYLIKRLEKKAEEIRGTNEIEYDCKINQLSRTKKIFWSVGEAMDLMSGLNPEDCLSTDVELRMEITLADSADKWIVDRINAQYQCEALFINDFIAKKINFLLDAKYDKAANTLRGRARPVDFINWANSNELKIPSILEESIQQIGSIKTKTLKGVAEDEIALEIEYKKLNDVDSNLILKYPDRERVLKKFKHNQQIGKVIVALIDKAESNNGYIRLDEPLKDLNIPDASFEPSKIPHALGFSATLELEGSSYRMRKVFFDGVCTKKCIEFYSRITKKRLSEIG